MDLAKAGTDQRTGKISSIKINTQVLLITSADGRIEILPAAQKKIVRKVQRSTNTRI